MLTLRLILLLSATIIAAKGGNCENLFKFSSSSSSSSDDTRSTSRICKHCINRCRNFKRASQRPKQNDGTKPAHHYQGPPHPEFMYPAYFPSTSSPKISFVGSTSRVIDKNLDNEQNMLDFGATQDNVRANALAPRYAILSRDKIAVTRKKPVEEQANIIFKPHYVLSTPATTSFVKSIVIPSRAPLTQASYVVSDPRFISSSIPNIAFNMQNILGMSATQNNNRPIQNELKSEYAILSSNPIKISRSETLARQHQHENIRNELRLPLAARIVLNNAHNPCTHLDNIQNLNLRRPEAVCLIAPEARENVNQLSQTRQSDEDTTKEPDASEECSIIADNENTPDKKQGVAIINRNRETRHQKLSDLNEIQKNKNGKTKYKTNLPAKSTNQNKPLAESNISELDPLYQNNVYEMKQGMEYNPIQKTNHNEHTMRGTFHNHEPSIKNALMMDKTQNGKVARHILPPVVPPIIVPHHVPHVHTQHYHFWPHHKPMLLPHPHYVHPIIHV